MEGGSAASVDRISIRVPPFWPEDPAVWFAQVEGQFHLNGITQDATKFYYVMSQLDHKYAAEVSDIITSPPAQDKYVRLKEELIRRLTASQEQRIRQLLEHEEMGDLKPSQFLRQLRNLAGGVVPDAFLRTLWVNRLPANMHAILSVQSGADLDSLSALADKVHEVIPHPQVASATAPADNDALLQRVEELTKQVAALMTQMTNMATAVTAQISGPTDNRSRPRSRSHSRGNPRRRSRHRESDMCWYHYTFGEKAHRCESPCSYTAAGNL
ncbi:uncharacterized protein LOC124154320 [Ischnura elegans]|uniref:uncharacterized protein LOC124154320 n=1 Tax=Ischnura elegans TaxID=197161 RepID=UPI001ED8B99C|nr:uncharacterized protein LOC124154320 [Ischnura elegans]